MPQPLPWVPSHIPAGGGACCGEVLPWPHGQDPTGLGALVLAGPQVPQPCVRSSFLVALPLPPLLVPGLPCSACPVREGEQVVWVPGPPCGWTGIRAGSCPRGGRALPLTLARSLGFHGPEGHSSDQGAAP